VNEEAVQTLQKIGAFVGSAIHTQLLPLQNLYNLLFSTLLNKTSLSGYGSTVILFSGFSSLAR
jgi:hypothetical protein